MSSEPKKGVKKQVLVLVTSLLIIETRKEVVKTTKTAEIIKNARDGKDGKEDKSGKYPGKLA